MPQSGRLTPVLSELAELAASFQIDSNAEQAAKEAVLDTVTAAAAAPRRDVTRALRQMHGEGPSAIWFTGETGAPVAAGFANAMASAVLDLDDPEIAVTRLRPAHIVLDAGFIRPDALACKVQKHPRAVPAGGRNIGRRPAIQARDLDQHIAAIIVAVLDDKGAGAGELRPPDQSLDPEP